MFRGRRLPGDRYGLLLSLLVAVYLMSAFATGGWVSALQVILFLGVILLALRISGLPAKSVRIAGVLALVGSTGAVTLALTGSASTLTGVTAAWAALLLLFAVVIIVRRVLAQPDVTIQSIFGAVSAYLIIGLMFAAVYGSMNRLGGGGFFANGSPASTNTFQYFSFTTLTTLGYGDFTAAGSGGRAVAVLEALAGQVFLATLIARLVATFRAPRAPEPARRASQAHLNSGHRPAARHPAPRVRAWRPAHPVSRAARSPRR
jgi:uncharacterized integral membrane protein